ncbi:unnamed protein product [Paramecium octaurelia]|uniref:Uncharacterized protein n=1 Tax=Paramecium octaurelia TaxID=43137 RepID=A0A8S1XX12_PAROT|nr:unnamed protein product [Paramecium octaurelia]
MIKYCQSSSKIQLLVNEKSSYLSIQTIWNNHWNMVLESQYTFVWIQ